MNLLAQYVRLTCSYNLFSVLFHTKTREYQSSRNKYVTNLHIDYKLSNFSCNFQIAHTNLIQGQLVDILQVNDLEKSRNDYRNAQYIFACFVCADEEFLIFYPEICSDHTNFHPGKLVHIFRRGERFEIIVKLVSENT